VAQIRALAENGDSWDDPSEDLLFELMTDVDRGEGTWVIVERVSDSAGQAYGQVLRQSSDAWVMEHREGSPESHVGTTVTNLRQAHALLTGWAFRLDGWDAGHAWRPVS
jgi:hypothetical protein